MQGAQTRMSALPRAAAADVLSDVLQSIRANGTASFRCEMARPWGLRAEASDMTHFYLVLAGTGWVRSNGARTPVLLQAGDLIVFPQGDAHALCSPCDAPLAPVCDVVRHEPAPHRGTAADGGRGECTRMICGSFRIGAGRRHALIDALPGMIHLRQQDARDAGWPRGVADLLAHAMDCREQGGQAMIDRLAEVLFIQSVRAHVCASPREQGFLAALSDRHIGGALSLMHARPAEAWTLDSLAREVALSRAVFAGRFRQLVREAPIAYLTRLRMEAARELLATTRLSVARVAEQVGYRSEAAFARAFKKTVGLRPGAVRRGA